MFSVLSNNQSQGFFQPPAFQIWNSNYKQDTALYYHDARITWGLL